jgi:hypothetical protein
MKRRVGWRWSEADAIESWADDGGLWINPEASPQNDCVRYPLCVEVLCWFEGVSEVQSGLRLLRAGFYTDTVLAAIRRVGSATRYTLYTQARESVVHERYFALRAVLRPVAIGLAVALDPGWEVLSAMQPSGDA